MNNKKNSNKKLQAILWLCLPLFFLFFSACSTKKANKYSIFFNTWVAHYNHLFNGLESIFYINDYLLDFPDDNFDEIIHLEPAIRDTSLIAEDLQRALSKAPKAIRRYSMEIQDKEYNKKMSEAYLLLGKSNFYKGNYLGALEAFNYSLQKHPEQEFFTEIKLWSAITYLYLGSSQAALKIVETLIDDPKIPKKLKESVIRTYADALCSNKKYDKAIEVLDDLMLKYKRSRYFPRYVFLKAQILSSTGKIEEATKLYNFIIKKRFIPQVFVIEAKIARAVNVDVEKTDYFSFVNVLYEMLENPEYKRWHGKIRLKIGDVYKKAKEYTKAVEEYEIALEELSSNPLYLGECYFSLGECFFELGKYIDSEKSYDEALEYLPKNTIKHFQAQRKIASLKNVIRYYKQIDENNMLIAQYKVSDKLASLAISEYVTQRKTIEALEAFKKTQRKNAQLKNDGDASSPALSSSSSEQENKVDISSLRQRGSLADNINSNMTGAQVGRTSSQMWYFYNAPMVQRGKKDFQKRFGGVKISDNWKLNYLLDNSTEKITSEPELTEYQAIISELPQIKKFVEENEQDSEDPTAYLESRLPKTEKQLNILTAEKNYAHFSLGVIFKEQFKDYKNAKKEFLILLNLKPNQDIELLTAYKLWEIFSEQSDYQSAQTYADLILQKYPDSAFAYNIKNPQSKLTPDKEAEKIYRETFAAYKEGDYQKVIETSKEFCLKNSSHELCPKFELLTAFALGKLQNIELVKRQLMYVAYNYTGKDEAEASLLMMKDLSEISTENIGNSYAYSIKGKHFFVVTKKWERFPIKQVINEIKTSLKSNLKEQTINGEEFYVLGEFENRKQTLEVKERFNRYIAKEKPNSYEMEKKRIFVISVLNWERLLEKQNIDEYIAFFEK